MRLQCEWCGAAVYVLAVEDTGECVNTELRCSACSGAWVVSERKELVEKAKAELPLFGEVSA